MAQWTESQGHLNGLGEADPVLQDRQNPVSQALRTRVFILLCGGGAIPGHRLRMRESWITQACGVALTVLPTVSTDLVYFQGSPLTLPVVGGGGEMGREDLIDLNLRDI